MEPAHRLRSLLAPLQGLRGWRPAQATRDAIAGVTLAAITLPEQMATARLGGFEPQAGFYAFVGGTLGFVLLGRNRRLTVGADSTITPIFALTLAGLAAQDAGAVAGTAVLLALLVGVFLAMAALLRIGVVAALLSVPVVTGFLGGIAVHIAASQLSVALGVSLPASALPQHLQALVLALPQAQRLPLLIALGMLLAMALCERINPRIPGALIAVAVATLLVAVPGAGQLGVATLGAVSPYPPAWQLPALATLSTLVPLALLLALVIIMQVAAVDRAFPGEDEPDVNEDFLGVGAGNLLSAAFGAFPVNASPPRTAVAVEAGATSQLGALIAAALVMLLAFCGGSVIGAIPDAALAGVLLFVTVRLFRLRVLVDIFRRARGEALLAVLTFLAVVCLPIQSGIAIGVGLALLHGVWMIAHSPMLTLARLPGSTVWWPGSQGETEPGVTVLAFQAPLLFANADSFKRQLLASVEAAAPPGLVVLEGSAIVEIDYSAAQTLRDMIGLCQQKGIIFVIARVGSVRAMQALDRFGITALLGPDGVSHSVQQAVDHYRTRGAS
ncbi:MAG: putative sulfate transporter [Stenotrophomonas maltophilia]|uniref:Putative sulfate transporter n=1 Tax=Stenotrophomonas maltophilia TaxID=40324 RepID=A0A7V8JK83_STEMA|nr:MAG: putative sulfate transporter [Stenotrophomonas maltophilia]